MRWLLVLLLQTGFVFSATNAVWKGPTTDSNWTTTGNWVGGVPPSNIDDIANFTNGQPSSTTPGGTVTLNASKTVGTINFDLSAAYTITPSPTTNTITLNVSSGGAAINVTNVNGNGAHTIAANLVLAKPLTVSQGSTGNFTISGGISESPAGQSLTKTGTNTLVLSGGGNSYTGGTFINTGILSLVSATDNQLGTAGVTIGSATLQFMNSMALSSTRTFTLSGGAIIDTESASPNTVTLSPATAGGITGSGSLTKVGSGILALSTPNSYTGGTTISAGQLNISNDNQLGNTSGPLNIGTAILLTTTGITSSRSGSFTGSPSTINTMGNTDTFNGNFSGSGALMLTGGGTVAFLGTNAYTGTTSVTGGTTLTGNTNGIKGNVSLDTGTFLTFNQNFNGTYSGQVSSTAASNGTLTKMGTGTVQLSGNNSGFSGPTNIVQGTLNVTNSLANSTLTVSPGATLSGTSTVGPTTNSGTISPGSVLTINGNLVLQASSNLFINIAPLSTDQIAVSGTATLNGSLTVNPAPGFYGFTACYTVLTSSGLILSPGLAPVTSTSSAFIPTVTTVGNNVQLCVQILAPFALFPFSNENTQAVGQNIDTLFAAGQLSSDLINVFNSFVGQSFATINDALDQMHPAPYSALVEFESESGGQLISLFHRMPHLSCCNCANSNRLWLEPFANSLTMKKHGMEIGFQANSGGLAFGYDGEIGNNFILGLGGAWNRGHLEWHDQRGHSQITGLYGALYGDYFIDQFFLGGTVLAGANFYETSRHLLFLTTDRRANASPMALDIMAQLATAYLFGAPHAFFYPYANVDFLYLHTHGFQEQGANGFNLTVQPRSDSTLRTEMGLALQVQDVNAAETMCISPQISLGWVNLCPIERKLYTATFQGASIPFQVRGWDITWNLFHVDFGLSFTYRQYSVDFEYNVEFSPDEHTILFNQHGNICLNLKW